MCVLHNEQVHRSGNAVSDYLPGGYLPSVKGFQRNQQNYIQVVRATSNSGMTVAFLILNFFNSKP